MRFVLVLTLGCSFFSPALLRAEPKSSASLPSHVTAAAIIHEINLARQNPALYATFVEQTRQNYFDNVCLMPGNIRLRTREGVRAIDDAIRFLRRAQPQPVLALSPGLCLAAADHCREQASGAMGHRGCNRSNPGDRISRYGAWSQGWAENVAYGRHNARDIVLALIIDDGVRGRGHRKNIFNRTYNVAGAAFGPHARFGSVCSIDFASGNVDSAFAGAGNNATAF